MGPVEKEFNPAEYPPEYITVGLTEAMPSILDRVEDAWIRSPNAVLVIPRGSHAFHSTHDFLALGKLQDSREVRVSIASADPIITGLARLLGFHVVDPPPGHPVLTEDPSTHIASADDDDEGNVEKPTAPLPLGVMPHDTPGQGAHHAGDAPGWVFVPTGPAAGTTTSTWLNNPGDYMDGQRAPKVNQYVAPAHVPGMPPPRTRPRQTGNLGPVLITDSSLSELSLDNAPRPPDATTDSGRLKARRMITEGRAYQDGRRVRYGGRIGSSRFNSRIMMVVAVLLVALLLGGSAYAYVYLPQGSVSVTPLSQSITDLPVEVTVLTVPDTRVSPSGARDSLSNPTINAAKITSPLSEEATRPASGTRQVARGRAQGMLTFTNRTGNAVTVPAGTQFRAGNGAVVQTAQAVTVPATIFGQSFGTAPVPIVATVDGPDGNIGAGQVSGIYGGTLNYSNSALQGGSIETIKVVKQEDIDALVADLHTKLEGETAGAVMGVLGAGQQIITQTISLQNARFDSSLKAGEDGDAVRVKLSADAEAYTFKDSDMQEAIVGAVRDYMQTSFPDEVAPTLSRNVDYTPPVVESVDNGKILYKTSAGARVAFALTPKLASEIQNLVKGKSVGQARTLIMSQTYSSYMRPEDIKAQLLWFSIGTLPNDPTRIDVTPSGSGAQYVPGTDPPEQPTPGMSP